MEAKMYLIEPLLERVEEYGKTSLEVLKLKTIDKTADISSTVISRLIVIIALLFFALTLSVALGLWLGELFGKNYYGFLIVALIYGFVVITLAFTQRFIKRRIYNSIIMQSLN
jgi:hypothetical protein